MTYMLLVIIFGVGNLLLTNTIEERSNKIVEILLSSVTANQLMMGKLIGIAAVGLTMPTVFIAGGIGVSTTIDTGGEESVAATIINALTSSNLLLVYLFYFLCAYIIFAMIFLAHRRHFEFPAGCPVLYGPRDAAGVCTAALHDHGVSGTERHHRIDPHLDTHLHPLRHYDARGSRSALMGDLGRNRADARFCVLPDADHGANFSARQSCRLRRRKCAKYGDWRKKKRRSFFRPIITSHESASHECEHQAGNAYGLIRCHHRACPGDPAILAKCPSDPVVVCMNIEPGLGFLC